MAPPRGVGQDLLTRQKRHERIAYLIGKGWEQEEIAVEMRINVRTVQRYVHNIRTGRMPRKKGDGFRGASARLAEIRSAAKLTNA